MISAQKQCSAKLVSNILYMLYDIYHVLLSYFLIVWNYEYISDRMLQSDINITQAVISIQSLFFNTYCIVDSSHRWSSMNCGDDRAWQVTHVRWGDGWLDMMLKPWHKLFFFKASITPPHTHTFTFTFRANLLLCFHLLCFVWVQRSVIVSDKFKQGKIDTNSYMK